MQSARARRYSQWGGPPVDPTAALPQGTHSTQSTWFKLATALICTAGHGVPSNDVPPDVVDRDGRHIPTSQNSLAYLSWIPATQCLGAKWAKNNCHLPFYGGPRAVAQRYQVLCIWHLGLLNTNHTPCHLLMPTASLHPRHTTRRSQWGNGGLRARGGPVVVTPLRMPIQMPDRPSPALKVRAQPGGEAHHPEAPEC